MATLDYVPRAAWGARRPKAAYTAVGESTGIAVHHIGSEAAPPANYDAAVARVRQTQNFHMDTRGWNDIAYGWLVGAGQVFEGRGWGWIDGADTGTGRLMHSVCWLGDSTAHEVPAADLTAIARVIAEHARHYPRAGLNIVGHGDINATDCPGDRLRAWLTRRAPASNPEPVPGRKDDLYMARHHIFQTRGPGSDGPNDLMAEVGIGAYGIVGVRAQLQPNGGFSDWLWLTSDADRQPFPAVEVTGGTNADGRQELVAYSEDGRCARKVRNLDGSWRTWAEEK